MAVTTQYYTLNDCCTDLPINWPPNGAGLQGTLYIRYDGQGCTGNLNEFPCPGILTPLIITEILNEANINVTGCLKLTSVLITDIPVGADILPWDQMVYAVEAVETCSDCQTCYYQITNCADENEVYCTTSNFSAYINNQIEDPNLWPIVHLVQFPNKCFYVEQVISCTSPINLTVDSSIPPVLGCAECEEKLVQYYELVNCNNTDITIYTSSDLSEYLGSIITLNEYPDDCWYIEVLTTATPSDITVTPNLSFNNCEKCTAQQYLLQDCNIDDPEPNIITNTDLSAYVGQVVTLINCPDKCWIVSETDSIETPQSVHVIANHTSCETCAVPPTPVVPDPPVYKSITPGYNTPGCEADKYESIVCNFSEAMYRQIMVDAYGITPCCGEDDIQYEISYELIKLKAIQDPEFTCGQIINCDCTTSTAGLSQPNCTPPN